MKCVHVTCYGDDVQAILEFKTNEPMPTPKEDQLLVRVMACSLNAADCKLMSGDVSLVMNPKRFPYVPGLDIAGIVEQVGTKYQQQFQVGNRVIAPLQAYAFGGLAEYVAFPAKQAAKIPDTMSFDQACALPTAAATAMEAVKAAKVKKGSRVMVLGGSGGVGTFVVQLAKAFGSSFVAATSTNDALVRSLGADQVFDYRGSKKWYQHFGTSATNATDTNANSNAETDGTKEKFDTVIDCVGDEDSFQHCASALKGKYVTIVGPKADARITNVWQLLQFMTPMITRNLFWPLGYSHGFKMVSCFPSGKEMEPIVDLVAQGKVRAVLDPIGPLDFTLENVVEAVRKQKSHRAKGKIVLRLASN